MNVGKASTLQASNTEAYRQGRGLATRDLFDAKTNLSTTFQKRMPGFSGHMREHGGRELIEIRKPVSEFAPTEQAAADSLVSDYWSSRNKRAH